MNKLGSIFLLFLWIYYLNFWKKNIELKKYSTSSATGGLWPKELYLQLLKFFSHCQKPKKGVRAATAPTGHQHLCSPPSTLWAVPTSKRYCRDGTSTAVRSAKDLNWALVWSRRKVRTGMIPSGWIKSSSSLKQVTWWKQNSGKGMSTNTIRTEHDGAFSRTLKQRDTAETKWQGAFNGAEQQQYFPFNSDHFSSPKQLLWTGNKVACSLDHVLPQEQFLEQHLPVLAGYTWAESQPHTPQKHRAACVLPHFLVWQ